MQQILQDFKEYFLHGCVAICLDLNTTVELHQQKNEWMKAQHAPPLVIGKKGKETTIEVVNSCRILDDG